MPTENIGNNHCLRNARKDLMDWIKNEFYIQLI